MSMIHDITATTPRNKRTQRKGRGESSGRGKTSGRGNKGAKARVGKYVKRGHEHGQTPIYRRLPKRGFSNEEFERRFHVVNLSDLDRFDDGAEVTVEMLAAAGLIRNSRVDVKILGVGDLTKALSVSAHGFSASAREKIEAAGGTVTPLRGEPTKGRKKKVRETDAVAAAETAAAAEGKVGAPDESVDAAPEGAAEAAEGEA